MRLGDSEFVDPRDLTPGDVLGPLPPDLKQRVADIYSTVGKYHASTLEEFEDGFMRDLLPEHEIRIWERIAAGALEYGKQGGDVKAASQALLAMTLGLAKEAVDAIGTAGYSKLVNILWNMQKKSRLN